MGLFDRLFSSGSGASSAPAAKPQPRKKTEAVFLDADAASSLGDVNLMKRSNTIRHTFPGTADNPGNKEMVAEVSSMEAKLEKMSDGLPGASRGEADVNLTGGIPKPVKKTFAQQMSPAQLEQRKRGSALGVNVPGGPAALKKEQEQAAAGQTSQPQITQQSTAKPGAIDPFRQMVKELNS
ncbi:hypothetical protein [Cyanobium sp. NIES-981]|uniref:hypothetical protein n=1 Tax=Cyanobium sp. NIES-981 TaxID=1851505 RepID=UPI0007DE1570|nr:hypothetical protein [Cyanobium sp. NIES-981]SBO42274.1 conserved protein of unknown function [Cyanobium sp. NIES-981]